ncbi:MAG: PhoH family protein [Sulfolobales archaeon]
MSSQNILEKIRPMSPGQEKVLEAFKDPNIDIIGIFGPSGTGKSLLSLAYGIDQIINERYKRFYIVRPLVNIISGSTVSSEIGTEIFRNIAIQYLQDLISQYIEPEAINNLLKTEKISFVDLHYLKGRSFDNALIFIDDVQNIPAESVIETLIRVGNESKLIIAGDPVFQRLRRIERDPSAIVREILLSEERARVIDLGINDVVRPGAKKGLKLLIELQLRNRNLGENEIKALDICRIHAPDADIVTIVDLGSIRDQYNLSKDIVPDYLIITKTPGRLIGKGGERIQAIEKDLGSKVRGLELSLDFKEWIRSIHPVSWVHKHIVEADFAGPQLKVSVDSDGAGAFIGSKGVHIRFVDHVFRTLLGVGVVVEQVEEERKKRRKR